MRREPIVFKWRGGLVSLGYLGNLRWRVRVGAESTDASDAREAIGLVFDTIFRGVSPGTEVAARAPLSMNLAGDRNKLVAEPKCINGWRCISRIIEGDVGDHSQLMGFVVEEVARVAEDAWAIGVDPERPHSLAPRFSFQAFSGASDPDALCRELEAALTQRMRAHPFPPVAFDKAMLELKAAGHDLWNVFEEVWAADFATRRKGAGLSVTRLDCLEGDRDSAARKLAEVSFRPRTA